MIEAYYSVIRGWLHRCTHCTAEYYKIHGIPAMDNGFVRLIENPHIFRHKGDSE